MEINRFCCEFVRDGKLGKIKQVSAVNYSKSKPIEGLPEEPIPKGDDWNTWLGPTEAATVQQAAAVLLDAVARLLRRRDDQLGCARRRSNPMGTRQRRHRPHRTLARWPKGIVSMKYADGTPVRFERDEGGPMGGAVFIGADCKMEINRNKFTTNPPDFVKDAPEPGRRTTSGKATAGSPGRTSRIGSTASSRASGRTPTSKSATARSASATW